jgi:hypothetical protein
MVYWNTAYGVGARDTNFIFHYSSPCSPTDFMTVLSFPRSFLSCRDYPRLSVSVDVSFSLDIFFLHVYINDIALFITTLCHDGSYTVLQERHSRPMYRAKADCGEPWLRQKYEDPEALLCQDE